MERDGRRKEETRSVARCPSGGAAAECDVTHMLFITWVEKDNGSKTPQFCLIHLHVPHLRHQFCEHPAETHTQTYTHQRSYVSNWYVLPAGISLERNAGGRPSVKPTNAVA